MEDRSRFVKTSGLAILALLAVAFVPAFPNNAVEGDPVSLPDPRVEVQISSADLAEILLLVRGGRFSSAHDRLMVQTRLPLRSISVASSSLVVGPGRPTARVPPPGDLEATFAEGCGPDCEEGITYYFVKRGDSWHVTKIEPWIV